jgi:perosamine synthetase
MTKQIKLFDPIIGKEEEETIKKVLKSNFWASGAGTGKVLEFEDKFNKYIGSDQCVAVSNGTAALHLALSLTDIKNKEVILPSLSFVSTAHAVIYNGGTPIFVDVDPRTLCIDPQMIKKFITKNTKVILPVHFGGMPCNLDEISCLCKEYEIILIEDAAHAAGASYKNKKIGKHGSAVCFSFHPVKNLAMPTGGAITLNGKQSSKFKSILQSRRWCGISNRKGAKYDVTDIGWNYYMNEFSAAIGIEQLKKLDYTNKKRKQIAKRYSDEIKLEKKMPFNKECSYHFYWIQVNKRDYFMKKMKENSIETGIHYLPIHNMKFYKNKTKLPITESVGKSIVSIPTHPNLDDSDVDKIIRLTNRFS